MNLLVKTASFLLAAIMWSGCQSDRKPVVSDSPLTTDEFKVYRAVLSLLNSQPMTQVKDLVSQTNPFDISRIPAGSACLQGIEFENLSQGSRRVHSFSAEIAKEMALNLVEPVERAKILENDPASKQKRVDESAKPSESGLLVVSEIVFDKKHQFAVLNYVFYGGSRFKYETTRVLEKAGGEWTTPVKRVCTVTVN